jgi:ankyrin repeat protein
MTISLHSLLIACQSGDAAKVDRIIESGEVGINAADENEITAIQVAAANCQEKIVKGLIDQGAKIEHRNNSGWTSLHQACYHGHTPVAKVLIEAGADINKRNKYGATPLNMAAAAGHLSTVRILLEGGAPVEDNPPPQYRVCPTPTMTGALHGRDTVLRTLVARGAKPGKMSMPSRWTPLMLAAAGGSKAAAQILLEHGADPEKLNLLNATAHEIAIVSGHNEVRMYLSTKTTVEPKYLFSGTEQLDLLGAARDGDIQRVEEILGSDDTDVDDTDQDGATPLILASISGHLPIVQLLVSLGADLNHQDRVNGWTSLMQATFYGHKAIISALIDAGADPSITANNGCTALDLATLVDDGNCEMVRLLATHTIEMVPPSLLMSSKAPKPRQAFHSRSLSTSNLVLEEEEGGIKGWWNKFSGRFKKLNRREVIAQNGIRNRAMTSGNELMYQDLVPQSSVFTLGFTGSDPTVSSNSLTTMDSPRFNHVLHDNTFSAGQSTIPEGHGKTFEGKNHNSVILKTRRFLNNSDSNNSSPATSLGMNKVMVEKYKVSKGDTRRKKSSQQQSVLSVLKKLHLEQHYPIFVSNEVDVEALKEMSDDDLLELGVTNVNDRKAILKYVFKISSKI